MSCKIGQLVISPESKSGPIGRILISQPSMAEEELLGRIFVVAEIQGRRNENLELVNFLFSQLENNYYAGDKLATLNQGAAVSPEAIFETAVADLNKQLADFLEAGHFIFSPESINLTIGVITDNRLYFSNIGANKALLIYEPKNSEGLSKGYSLVNITKRTSDPAQEIFSQEKIFSSVIKGAVPLGGVFMFANEALFEFLAEKQLIKITSTLPPAGAAKQFLNILEQAALSVPFLALIIKNQKPLVVDNNPNRPSSTDLKVRVHQPSAPIVHQIPTSRENLPQGPERDVDKQSIRDLNRTESRTADILRPSGLISFTTVKNIFSSLQKNVQRVGKKNKLIIDRPETVRREQLAIFKKLKTGLGQLTMFSAGLLMKSWQLATNQEARLNLAAAYRDKKSKLKTRHYLALSLVLISLLALSFNIIYINQQKAKKDLSEQIKQISDSINKKYDDLASSMIYGNRDVSKTNLQEIEALVSQLPKTTPEEQKIAAEAQKRYQTAIDQLYNVIRVAPGDVLPNSSGLSAIWAAGDGFYGLQGRSLAKYTTVSESVIADIGADNCLSIPASESPTMLYCLSAGNLIDLDISARKATAKTIANPPAAITGGGLYNGKLYLAGSDKNIYRWGGGTASWSGKTTWLKAPAPLMTTGGLAIDGYIYLAGGSQLIKYRSGSAQDFTLETVSPALTNIDAVSTGKNSDYILVADNANKRVLAYDKTGKLAKQYSSDNWTNIKALSLSDSGTSLYVLTDGGVYKLQLK